MADEISAVQAIKKFSGQHQTRLRWWLAYAGDGNGNVYTSQANYYLCRYPLTSSPAVEIYNNRVGLVDGLRIIVGYTAYQPNLLQVLDVADQRLDGVDPNDNPINPGDPGYVSVLPHWVNHQYLGSDSGLINFRQLSPLGVFPNYPADLNVRIWPGTIPRPGADVNVSYQLFDLTASVPVSGARYTLISFDSTGAVVATDGTINAGGFAALMNADIPDTPAGNWRSCAVVLYDGQTAIVETHTENDFLDLRFPEEQSAGILALTNTHIFVGNASNVATDVAMSSDATIANTGALTLATVNGNVGSFTNANITVNAKGLITSAANGTAGATIVHDDVSASCNGVAVQFSTSTTFTAGSTEVTLNGLRLRPGVGNSYVEDIGLGSITLATAPLAGDELLIAYVASGTGAATLTISDVYIATTGNDTTGNGSSGTPYATLAKALSVLPDRINSNVTIHIAAGTYAEPIDVYRFTTREDATITLAGPATFTGTVTYNGATVGALIRGPVRIVLSSITANVTADIGIGVYDQALVTLTGCVLGGATALGLYVEHSTCDISGNLTITGCTGNSIGYSMHSKGLIKSSGTISITGSGAAAVGVWIGYQSQLFVAFGGLTVNITIVDVLKGFQLNLHAIFQYWDGAGSIVIDNASTPSNSMAVQCTDLSTWSTTRPLTLDHFTYGFDVSSLSYAEASGTRTVTNVGTTSNTYLSGVTYLP